MYAVVGCTDCEALWIVEDLPAAKTATCPQCQRCHQAKTLRQLATESSHQAAQQARSALLAHQQGNSAAFASIGHISELESRLAQEETGVTDREYLSESGLDPATVADAEAKMTESVSSSPSPIDQVKAAIDTLGEPTESNIVATVAENGVEADRIRTLIEKLHRQGEITKERDRFRRL